MGHRLTYNVGRRRASTPKPFVSKDPLLQKIHKLRQTFMGEDLPPNVYDTGADWAKVRLRHIGTNEATAYFSDKWGGSKTKSFEEFKHVSEAPQELYAVDNAMPGAIGPIWSPRANKAIMPLVLAELAPLIFFEGRLFVDIKKSKDGDEGVLGDGDEGCVRIRPPGCLLYAGYMRDARDPSTGETILVAIHPKDGVQYVVMGSELDVTKDGIVG